MKTYKTLEINNGSRVVVISYDATIAPFVAYHLNRYGFSNEIPYRSGRYIASLKYLCPRTFKDAFAVVFEEDTGATMSPNRCNAGSKPTQDKIPEKGTLLPDPIWDQLDTCMASIADQATILVSLNMEIKPNNGQSLLPEVNRKINQGQIDLHNRV